MWLYGSGFPKSMNIGLAIDKKNGIRGEEYIDEHFLKRNPDTGQVENGIINKGHKDGIEGAIRYKCTNEWQGWGSQLKPSFEPIIIARKPFKGSLVDNVIEYGVGGINIDECRVEPTGEDIGRNNHKNPYGNDRTWSVSKTPPQDTTGRYEGRFPANTILTYDETDFDEVCGGFPNTKSGIAVRHNSGGNTFGGNNKKPPMEDLGYNDSGSASRYFMNCKYTEKDKDFRRYIYTPKASKKDRDEGLEGFEEKELNLIGQLPDGFVSSYGNIRNKPLPKKNTHPTVKPTTLMQYLVRLVTPKGGTILDPFMGSGSTGKAVMFENKERKADYNFIGIEKEKDYCNIAEARIRWAEEYKEKKENENQISFEDLEAKDEIQI